MMPLAPGFVVLILVKATVLLVAAGLITLALRRRSAAYRHTVWGAALVGLLALPALAASLPSWYVGDSERQPVLTDDAVVAEHEDLGLNGATVGALDLAERLTPQTRSGLTLIWLFGCAAVLLWVLLGHVRMHRLLLGGQPVEAGPLFSALQRAMQQTKARRRAWLALHSRIAAPMVVGIRRPVLLLPSQAVEWPHERVERILVHELAHVRRHDNLSHLAARVTCALYWFHPLVWFAAQRLKLERERAADDVVLETGASATDYAEDLVGIARSAGCARPVAAAGLIGENSLGARIGALLDSRHRRTPMSRRSSIVAAGLATSLLVPMACVAPGGDAPAKPSQSFVEPTEPRAVFQADTAEIDLLGAEIPETVERKEAFAVSLYWRVRTPFPKNPDPKDLWRVFVHFDGPLPDGHTRILADHRVDAPGPWSKTAEIVEDRFAVMAPHTGYPPGDYAIYVGWFRGTDGNWTNAEITAGEPDSYNRFRVGTITLN